VKVQAVFFTLFASISFSIQAQTVNESINDSVNNNCYYEIENACEEKSPCADLSCEFIRNEFIQVDTDGDGAPDTSVPNPIWECKGKIGFYDPEAGWISTATAAEGKRDDLYQDRTEPTTIYCWKKAGCPVQGCTEVTDLDNHERTVWKCSDPPQTYVNDDSSKQTEYQVVVSSYRCKGPPPPGPPSGGGSMVETTAP